MARIRSIQRLTAILLILTAIATPTGLAGQAVIVERNVNLRRDPSTGQPPLRLLKPPDALTLVDTLKVNRYWHVRTEDDEEGWVWSVYVRVAPVDSAAPIAGPLPVAAIDEIWEKPEPDARIFSMNGVNCGPTGDGGDGETNHRKNRVDLPASYHPVTFDAVAGLGTPANLPVHRHDWTTPQAAEIARVEGAAITVTGFLVALKVQSSGSGESTNCHMTRKAEVDWHIALTRSPGAGEAESIVVETTPRTRTGHPRWTDGRLRPWVDSSDSVRISGWLMMDPQHRNHLHHFRVTLWEIHPVTQIEVWSSGQWVTLDTVP